jgi:hypothetical protein
MGRRIVEDLLFAYVRSNRLDLLAIFDADRRRA